MIIDNKKIIKEPTKKTEEVKTYMNDVVKLAPDGAMVRVKTWEPAGSPDGNELKRDITKLLDQIVKENSKFTLAEMGYLHMNLISFCNGQVNAKIYFAPELATQTETNGVNTNGKIVPHKALEVFQNYLYVGELKNAVTFESMPVPRYDIERNERDQLTIRIKDGKKINEDGEAVVLNCNLLLLIAAVLDVNPNDPNFDVKVETVGKSKKKDRDMAIMINAGAQQEFPVRITAQYTVIDNAGTAIVPYEPDAAISFLMNRMKKMQEMKSTKNKLANKASDNAKETAKNMKKKTNAWAKYR